MATNVNVRLFAGLQNMVGARNVALSLPSGATVETLRDQLVDEYPVLQAFINTLVIAVGEEIVPVEQVLVDGAQVELIPPISGGSVVQ